MDDAESESSDKFSYTEKKHDLPFLLGLVDKFAKIELIKHIELSGFIYTVDPVSYSVVLQTPHNDTYKTVIIPGHAVQSITCLRAPDNVQTPQRLVQPAEDLEIASSRKTQLVAWLKSNLLPVSEGGNDIVVGSASILPPYGDTDIFAETPDVAMRIRKIMSSMPADFKC